MTASEFDTILEARLNKTRAVLATKATEYAVSEDRLHNFKRAASMTGETPIQVCVGFMVKHLVSVLDITDGLAKNCVLRAKLTDEKIGDAINYLVLLEALIAERLKA